MKRNETGSELESWAVGTWRCIGLFIVLFCMFLLVIKWYISDLLESSLRITKNQSWVTSWEMV